MDELEKKTPENDKENQNKNLISDICLLKGKTYEFMDLFSKASMWYKRALMNNPFCYEAWEKLIDVSLISMEEIQQLLDALPIDENNTWLRHLYQCKIKKFSSEEKVNNQNNLISQYNLDQNEDVLTAHSETLFYNNKFTEAYNITKQILTKDLYHPGAIFVHIGCLVELNMVNELYILSHKLIEELPKSELSWYSVGCYYYLIKGKGDLAKRYLNKSTILNKNFGPAWLVLGHTFARDREHEHAMTSYRTASRLLVGSHIPSLSLASELLSVYNDSLAEDFIMKAMKMQKDDPFPLNELGVLYYRKMDYERALKNFLKALEMVGDNNINEVWEPTIFNIGHCYRKLKKYDDAIEYYKLAIKVVPNNGSTYTALALTYHMNDNIEKAIQYYEQALYLCPDDQLATEMLDIAITTHISNINLQTLTINQDTNE